MAATVNTNAGALQALASLRDTNKLLDMSSKRVQTGYRVADAFDDASTFAVAQGIRSNMAQYKAVQNSLAGAEGMGAVANAALTGISNLLSDIKVKITQLADGSLSTAQIVTYGNDLAKMLTQVQNYFSQAVYNGKNIFTSTAAINYLADTAGTALTLSAQNGTSTSFSTFATAARTFSSAMFSTAGASAGISIIATAVTAFETTLNAAIGNVAAETRAFTLQKGFISSLLDATTIGLGAMVDADVSAESAAIQALQIRQQLGYQALSIANQQPQSLLSLFR